MPNAHDSVTGMLLTALIELDTSDDRSGVNKSRNQPCTWRSGGIRHSCAASEEQQLLLLDFGPWGRRAQLAGVMHLRISVMW